MKKKVEEKTDDCGMKRVVLTLPAKMYEVWEAAWREELTRQHPKKADVESLLVSDEDTLERGRENFIFRGFIFAKGVE